MRIGCEATPPFCCRTWVLSTARKFGCEYPVPVRDSRIHQLTSTFAGQIASDTTEPSTYRGHSPNHQPVHGPVDRQEH